MKTLAVIILLAVTLAVTTFAMNAHAAEGCGHQKSSQFRAAREEYEKVKESLTEFIPDAGYYSSRSKGCLGALSAWVPVIGFEMPSINQLLEDLCSQIQTKVKIPMFAFNYSIQIGDSDIDALSTRYWVENVDSDSEQIFQDVWSEIWNQ